MTKIDAKWIAAREKEAEYLCGRHGADPFVTAFVERFAELVGYVGELEAAQKRPSR